MHSDHGNFKDSMLFLSDAENLLIQTPSAPSTKKRIQVQQGTNPSTIVVHDSQKDFLILAGPSGKGEHQLRATSDVVPFGDGLTIYHTSWLGVKNEGGEEMVLRYQDEDIDGARWVAVPEDDGSWSVWWYEPNPANYDDLPGAVDIEIELAPV
ncbi:hypothetical protein FOQG_16197 [Fusarium oxysporum f. sp. raphani 54005]|uniref:Uncharacterized protein n=1 Tax=Fusarium oxysporum f. sp. raphani 54005 TaxID=1089458 RepID=X0BJZ3_FUSOX|nr:hypothetical protein FOQG_16197 [Fusarium oxysporum f. sp. raphani 54005]